MTGYYLDTSTLVKRYVDEAGSVWLRGLFELEPRPLFVTSHLMIAEMTSAFNRRVREGSLSSQDYARLKAIFHNDCLSDYQIISINQAVVDSACNLMERHPLRALDAIHLATGLSVHQLVSERDLAGLTLLSADDQMLAAAGAEGMSVENPNRH